MAHPIGYPQSGRKGVYMSILWLTLAFMAGGVTGILLIVLMLMAGRSHAPPIQGQQREPLSDEYINLHHRDDGTRSVNTITRFDVTDNLHRRAWPLDHSHVKYRAYP